MSGPTKTRRLLVGAFALTVSGTLAVAMASNAPLIISPIMPSLPPGLYVRTFEPPKIGMIAAFQVPGAAKRYKVAIGETVHHDFLFMKPIVAGPGDHVCNRQDGKLTINNKQVISVRKHDHSGHMLPVWQGCRELSHDEFFTLSHHAPNSFDSRYYGPIDVDRIGGVYRRLIARSEVNRDD